MDGLKFTKAVLAQICMGVFFICSVPDTFSSETTRGPPEKAPQTEGGSWTTV
jgi:hypothetical protein